MKTSNKILLAAGFVPVLLYLIVMIALRVEFKHYMDDNSSTDKPALSESVR